MDFTYTPEYPWYAYTYKPSASEVIGCNQCPVNMRYSASIGTQRWLRGHSLVGYSLDSKDNDGPEAYPIAKYMQSVVKALRRGPSLSM